jgi:hypothetical protein
MVTMRLIIVRAAHHRAGGENDSDSQLGGGKTTLQDGTQAVSARTTVYVRRSARRKKINNDAVGASVSTNSTSQGCRHLPPFWRNKRVIADRLVVRRNTKTENCGKMYVVGTGTVTCRCLYWIDWTVTIDEEAV